MAVSMAVPRSDNVAAASGPTTARHPELPARGHVGAASRTVSAGGSASAYGVDFALRTAASRHFLRNQDDANTLLIPILPTFEQGALMLSPMSSGCTASCRGCSCCPQPAAEGSSEPTMGSESAAGAVPAEGASATGSAGGVPSRRIAALLQGVSGGRHADTGRTPKTTRKIGALLMGKQRSKEERQVNP